MLYAIAAAAAAVVFYIIYRISKRLFFIVLDFCANIIISFAAITVYNMVAVRFGAYIGINVFSVLLCAVGGIPGFAAEAVTAAVLLLGNH